MINPVRLLILAGVLHHVLASTLPKTLPNQVKTPVRTETDSSQQRQFKQYRPYDGYDDSAIPEDGNVYDPYDSSASPEFPPAVDQSLAVEKGVMADRNGSLVPRQYPANGACECYNRESCGCVCRRPISWEDFQLLPQHFRSCPGFTLALRGGQFHSFPADYFYRIGDVKEFVLDISRINFQYLLDPSGEASPFNRVTFDTSAFIRIHQVTVSRSWNWASFYDLAPTRSLAYCEVQVVGSTVSILTEDFGNICRGAVIAVTINDCGMMALENEVFVPFYKLNEVDLSDNRLRVMMRSYFSYPANELEVISLRNNDIHSLPSDMFSGMPSLTSVDLKGNPITTLDEATFSPIFRSVEIVGLETLPLKCDCHMKWLKEPTNQHERNVYRLAGTRCQSPNQLRGYSPFSDTQVSDLVC